MNMTVYTYAQENERKGESSCHGESSKNVYVLQRNQAKNEACENRGKKTAAVKPPKQEKMQQRENPAGITNQNIPGMHLLLQPDDARLEAFETSL